MVGPMNSAKADRNAPLDLFDRRMRLDFQQVIVSRLPGYQLNDSCNGVAQDTCHQTAQICWALGVLMYDSGEHCAALRESSQQAVITEKLLHRIGWRLTAVSRSDGGVCPRDRRSKALLNDHEHRVSRVP